jgi:hypothetical protein
MKNIQLVHLTPSGTLLYIEGGHSHESALEGLVLNCSALARSIFKTYLHKSI